MVTTCDTKGQQQDAKNNSELLTRWTKTTCKTSEEVIRRSRNRSVEASLVTYDDDGDYEYFKMYIVEIWAG